MKRPILLTTAALFLLTQANAAKRYDIVDFFEEEAFVSSASRKPAKPREAPATVHVVTAEDIKESGAQTLWDALRGVPGVDVMTLRTFYGQVGIRGINSATNNRTLVLLDGRTVMNGFFDYTNWEAIPVSMQEIDRIEVVEGPVSSIHGTNALSGAINIITKTPAQLERGLLNYRYGERDTHLGGAIVANQFKKFGFKLSSNVRKANRFSDASALASESEKVHGLVSWNPSKDSQVSVSGGASNHNTQFTGTGGIYDDGITSFVRSDFKFRGTAARAFWNRGRTVARGHPLNSHLNLDYDTYNVDVEHGVDLPFSNHFVGGIGYRRNEAESLIFAPGRRVQNLWTVFFEDAWRPQDDWTLSVSGRFDKHPLTAWVFSPRGSLIYRPARNHSVRATAGTAFRQPTLLENYIDVTTLSSNPGTADAPNPPYTRTQATVMSNLDLDPERMFYQELAHTGQWGFIQTTLTGFHYQLSDAITGLTSFLQSPPPLFRTAVIPVNRGEVEAWGGEIGARAQFTTRWTGFANYSYQNLTNTIPALGFDRSAPRNKVNAGTAYSRWGATGSLWMHWVDEAEWPVPGSSPLRYHKRDDYILLNGRVGYVFPGKLKGLELHVTAFNLANNEHMQITPAQGGAILRARWMIGATYKF